MTNWVLEITAVAKKVKSKRKFFEKAEGKGERNKMEDSQESAPQTNPKSKCKPDKQWNIWDRMGNKV